VLAIHHFKKYRRDFLKKIKLILTGGTIGSRIDELGNISVSAEPILLKYSDEKLKNSAEFEVSEPFRVLSENMTMADRECLIREILAAEGLFDGVIVAHGSDTLCYTAALVSMAARHLSCPVVFIASDKVLSDPLSNGISNFESAVTLITSGIFSRGTFICYKDKNGENSVYLGTRLSSAEPLFDSFLPFDDSRIGVVKSGNFYYESGRFNPSIEEINTPRKPIIKGKFSLKDSVLMTHSSPAFDLCRLDIKGLSAIINYGYHCGTVNESSMLALAKRCESEGVDVYLASFKDRTAPVYESLSEILRQKNVKRLYNISPESAFAKVVLAYSLDKELLSENLFFEEIY
jgi:L-asparaginase